MSLSVDLKKQILSIIEVILVSDYRVILFGSYASGKENKYSDIDIAIKASALLDKAKWSMIEESFEESSIIQKIDVVDYHRVKASFKKIIDTEGIIIS